MVVQFSFCRIWILLVVSHCRGRCCGNVNTGGCGPDPSWYGQAGVVDSGVSQSPNGRRGSRLSECVVELHTGVAPVRVCHPKTFHTWKWFIVALVFIRAVEKVFSGVSEDKKLFNVWLDSCTIEMWASSGGSVRQKDISYRKVHMHRMASNCRRNVS